MQANQAFPIRTMAPVLGVTSSGYHDWLDRQPREQAHEVLLENPGHPCDERHQLRCATQLAQLARKGVIVNKKRIEHLMRSAGLKGISSCAAPRISNTTIQSPWVES